MYISAISTNNSIKTKQNFTSSMPVYKVYCLGRDGVQRELSNGDFSKGIKSEISGVVTALVKRLNKVQSAEKNFFLRFIADFKALQEAASTLIGNTPKRKATVFWGMDARNVYEYRRSEEVASFYTREQINENIKKTYIENPLKQIRTKSTNERVGLILYTNELSTNYPRLNGIEIVTENGKLIAELKSKFSDREQRLIEKAKQITEQRENEKLYQEYLDELAAAKKPHHNPQKKKTNPAFVQGELFDASIYSPKRPQHQSHYDAGI